MSSGDKDANLPWGWNPALPTTQTSGSHDHVGDYPHMTEETRPKPNDCECGISITYGEDCPPEFHSSWCRLHKEKK